MGLYTAIETERTPIEEILSHWNLGIRNAKTYSRLLQDFQHIKKGANRIDWHPWIIGVPYRI